MDINYFDPPEKTMEEILERYPEDSFLIMDQVLECNSTYCVVFQDLLDLLKYAFEDRAIRSRMIKYKFHTKDKTLREMELRHMVSNLIFWRPFIDMDKVDLLDESYIVDLNEFSSKYLLKYINEKLLPINEEDFYTKNAMIDDIYHGIIAIAHGFCMLIGNGISLYNMKTFEERYPEVHDLMYTDLDESLTPKEIEEEMDRRMERLKYLIVNDTTPDGVDDNDFKSLYASGSGIKDGQMKEFMLKIGMKSDLSGNIIAKVNNGSFLVNGLYSPSLLYINALTGRKALIAVKQGMGIPGAFAKKLCQSSTSSGILADNNEPCDSVMTVDYHILDDQFLSLLDGRYYYDAHGKLQCVNYLNDKHLIGKIVRFKSPVTCCGENGICKYCYGKLFDINSTLFSVGALTALKSSEPAQQGVLSTKHSQQTDSAEIVFSEGFNELFEIDSSEVILREDSDLDADLYMVLDTVIEEESDDTVFYYTYGFEIKDASHNTIYTIREENEAKLYLTDQIADIYKSMRDKKAPIPLENLDDESSLFNIEVKSKELTEPIKIFEKILNKKDHGGATNISELCQMFAEALIRMGQRYDLVHAEVILKSLIRKKSNILEYADFSRNGDPNDIQILTLNSSLQNHPSALISLPYGYLKKQLLSTELYNKKGTSHLDPLYVSQLSSYLE